MLCTRSLGAAAVGGCLIALLTSSLAVAGESRLAQAVAQQDRAAIAALLKQKADVNAPQPDGATALHWAAYLDDVETASKLVQAGARVDATNDYGVTPLNLACTNGSAALVELLLGAGANANLALPTGETPLMAAARAGDIAIVRGLMARGANVLARERQSGQTALMWAAAAGHAAVVQALIEHGAEVNGRTTGPGRFTPLLFAAKAGSLDAVRALVAAGAEVNAAATGAPWCAKCGGGGEPLLIAAVHGHMQVAGFLLDHGADPNAASAGYTALHWAAGSWETTLRFSNNTTRTEWNALTGLKGQEKLDFIRTLLAHGANPNARTQKTPSRVGGGSAVDNPDLYQTLIDATPFLLAALAGDAPAMRLLAAAGADPLAPTAGKMTPLMEAAGLGRVSGEHVVTAAKALEAVKVALELGGDVNAVSAAGDTALHAASVEGTNDVVTFLVEHGARPNVKNRDGDTPWLIAVGKGTRRGGINPYQPETAALLLKLGAVEEEKTWSTRYGDLQKDDDEYLRSGVGQAGAQLRAIEEAKKQLDAASKKEGEAKPK